MNACWKAICLALVLLLTLENSRNGLSIAQAQSEIVSVVIQNDNPPFTFQDKQDKPNGFAIDLMNALSKQAGFPIEYTSQNADYIIPGVVARLYDVAISCLLSDENTKKQVDFSAPYFATGLVIVVQKDDKLLHRIEDLTPEVVVSVVQDSAAARYIHTYTQVKEVEVTTLAASYEQVIASEVTAAISPEINALEYIKTHPQANLKIVGQLLTYEECGIAVNKDEPQLLAKLNESLAQIKTDGTYAKIYQQWFGDRPQVDKSAVAKTPTVSAQPQTTPSPTPTPNGQLVNSPPLTTTRPITGNLTENLAGVYYLTSKTIPEDGSSTYQIVTLTPDNLWLSTETIQNRTPITGSNPLHTEQGMWQANAADQMKAMVLTFYNLSKTDTNTGGNIGIMRKDYQMTVQTDGSVSGSYTLKLYGLNDALLHPAASATEPQTIEFTGQRIQVGQ